MPEDIRLLAVALVIAVALFVAGYCVGMTTWMPRKKRCGIHPCGLYHRIDGKRCRVFFRPICWWRNDGVR